MIDEKPDKLFQIDFALLDVVSSVRLPSAVRRTFAALLTGDFATTTAAAVVAIVVVVVVVVIVVECHFVEHLSHLTFRREKTHRAHQIRDFAERNRQLKKENICVSMYKACFY